jgi:hypothetical protein
MVLIQLLLPAAPAEDGRRGDALKTTADELRDHFGGLTAYVRSPAEGLWTSPDGRTEFDDVVMIEVVTERFERPWWKQYAATLAIRFDQDAIHIRALPIELLDPEAS